MKWIKWMQMKGRSMCVKLLNAGDREYKRKHTGKMCAFHILYASGMMCDISHLDKRIRQEGEVENLKGLGASNYEEGFEKGYEKGFEKGYKEVTANFIRRMLEVQEPLEKISLYTGYTMDQVLEVRNEMGSTVMNER